MTEWNFDLTQAPRDGSHVILAMPNNTTLRSYWVKPKHDPEHWCMLSHKNEPVAWMLWPEHPFANNPVQDAEEAKTEPKAKAESDPEQLAQVQRLGPAFILEDVGGGA